MVQSLRTKAGAIAGRTRPNGEIAGRTAGPGRSVVDMEGGNTMTPCATIAMATVSLLFVGVPLLAGDRIGYAQQRSDNDNVNAAVNAFHAALSNLDIGKMQNVWAQEPYVVLINPRDKAPAVGWDVVKKDWQDRVFGFWAELKLSPKQAPQIHIDQGTPCPPALVAPQQKNKTHQPSTLPP